MPDDVADDETERPVGSDDGVEPWPPPRCRGRPRVPRPPAIRARIGTVAAAAPPAARRHRCRAGRPLRLESRPLPTDDPWRRYPSAWRSTAVSASFATARSCCRSGRRILIASTPGIGTTRVSTLCPRFGSRTVAPTPWRARARRIRRRAGTANRARGRRAGFPFGIDELAVRQRRRQVRAAVGQHGHARALRTTTTSTRPARRRTGSPSGSSAIVPSGCHSAGPMCVMSSAWFAPNACR